MAVSEKISKLVAQQFPAFYKEEGANFLAFMEAYYAWMEENGNLTDGIRNLESYRDINTTTEDYLEYFRRDLLPSIPRDIAGDKRLLAKFIKQFNQSRGTLASYKFLFRAVYNEDVEVNYPADQILKVSDGDWRIDRYLVSVYDRRTYNFIGKTIVGTSSRAQALVEDVVRKNINGRDIMQILLSNVKGSFNHLEPIRLLSDTNATGHTVIVEAGIESVEIVSPGGEYLVGDVVSLQSDDVGEFGKVVVVDTVDLGGTLTFSLVNGGSGFTAVGTPGTTLNLFGGDGSTPASFTITQSDIVDTFAISTNVDLIAANNVYGAFGPPILQADGSTVLTGATFANTVLSSPDYGFLSDGESIDPAKKFRTHANAVLVVANTSDPGIQVGDSLFGETSGANATVIEIRRAHNSTDVVLGIDGYLTFSTAAGGEKVNIGTATGTTVGTVSAFNANAIGKHVLTFGWITSNSSPNPYPAANYEQLAGLEIAGVTSGSYGVIKKVVDFVANGYSQGVGGADDRDLVTVIVSSNTSANLTNQFDVGPVRSFIEDENLRIVGSATILGTVDATTSNNTVSHIYTKLEDAFNFEATTFGTIAQLSNVIGGAGYSVAPTIELRENTIAALGIGEQYLTVQTDDVNWETGNSQITTIQSVDRVIQSSTGASGDVKGGLGATAISLTQYSNGTYESVIRVWQDFLQREPGNITFANNAAVTIKFYDDSYVPGESDTRTSVAEGTAKIVGIDDRGILGKNAVITTGVGSNGTITALRVLDSGFAYKQNEVVRLPAPDRNLAVGGSVKLTMGGVANAEGYYTSTRSHVSSLRGYIQDGRYYQEFSYEILSAIAIDRYRDIALKLVHPAGQILFGKYRTQSNVYVDVVANTALTKRMKATGTVSIDEDSFDLVGSGTAFTSEFASNTTIIIEYAAGQYYNLPLNIVSDDTTANVKIAWANSDLSGATAYYNSGSF